MNSPFCTAFSCNFQVNWTVALKLSLIISPRERVCFCLLWQMLTIQFAILFSDSLSLLQHLFLIMSVHTAIAFPPIFSKWNFTKGFADGGKLNLSSSNRDADPQQVFSYKESLSSLLQKGAASITVSVPQTNPQSGKQHDLRCTFLFHVWSAVGLISRFSKVSLVLSGLC